MGLFEAYDAGADIVILINRAGNIAEGPEFNVFVVKDGCLATPGEGVLDGITRRTAIELCKKAKIECVLTEVSPSQVYHADEIFLSSTAGGLIAVTVVDNRQIGDGKPGPITNQLSMSYWLKLEAGWYATPIDYE